ncbi:thioredoxin domain-containing protein [Candidatus Woesearchaeota archaeon]|nr:thioredoxin domain-containing protein [Candidatus Woesearchaeota archaeon]
MNAARILLVVMVVTLFATVTNSYMMYHVSEKLNNLNVELMGQPQGQGDRKIVGENIPKREVSADDDAAKGSSKAPITIIEFSDFQCPYCGRFYAETLPLIKEKYIDTGKVQFVYRDFPLGFHQHAQKAAEAAECAGEQEKYWEYHNLLFENQNALDTTSLKAYAKQLGLNTGEFNQCLDEGKMTAEVQNDFEQGSRYGVTGTPAFFINGVEIVGAQPYAAFEQIIEQELQ